MNRIIGIAIMAAAVAVSGTGFSAYAQKTKKGVMDLSGYELKDGGLVERPVDKSFQGLAIHKNYMVGLNDTGYASLYKLADDGSFTRVSDFALGSRSDYNHANVADFGVEYYAKGDAMPVLYVSQCKTDKETNVKDACYVERISPDGKSETVQTILFDAVRKYYRGSLQYVIDKKRKLMVGYGNTLGNMVPGNNYRIMIFKLPKIKDGKTVVLKEEDIVETYTIEQYDKTFPSNKIGQGATIAGNCILFPTGLGSEKYPSVIFSWDLKNHKLINAIDMTKEVPFELEDCDFYKNRLYLQCNHGKKGHFMIMYP